MLTERELVDITGVASYEVLGLPDPGRRQANRFGLVCRATLFRHTVTPTPQPVTVPVREISATGVGLVCDAAAAPLDGEPFTLGIERKRTAQGRSSAAAANATADAAPPLLWVHCAAVHQVPTGWSGRCLVGARFVERTDVPKFPPPPPPETVTQRPAARPAPAPPPPAPRRAPAADPRLDLLFDQHPFGLALIGADHRITRANRAFCELTGYSAAELAKLTFVEITHPEDIGPDLQLAARLFAGEIASYQLPKRYVHKSGRIVRTDLTAATLRDPATNQVVAGVATVRPLPDDYPGPDPQSAHELARLRRAILD